MELREISEYWQNLVVLYLQIQSEKETKMIPQDPVMLLSYINTQLRDNYSSLESLFEGLNLSKEEQEGVVNKLQSIGYSYNNKTNQFC